MNKKVLMINGSFRKKKTYNVLQQIAEKMKERDIDFEIINLFDHDIKDCTGCNEICTKQGRCNVEDDMPAIMQKILESDGLVLGSPVHLGNVSSKFLAFADRTNAWHHKPEIAGKPILLVVATEITGIKETLRFLKQFAIGLGGQKAGTITRNGANDHMPVQLAEVASFISLLLTDKKQYKPTMTEVISFQLQKILVNSSDGDAKKFWEEKNWNDKYYYYDCKINIFKKLYSLFIYKIVSGIMK